MVPDLLSWRSTGTGTALAVVNGVVALLVVLGVLPVAVAIVAAIALLLGVVRRPQRGVLALAALVPFDGLLQVIPHSSGVRSWKELLVVVTLAATFVCPQDARARGARDRPGWLVAVVLLIVLGVLSGVAVGLHQGVTGVRIDFFYVLLAIAIWRCPLGRADIDHLVTILMATGFVTAMFGLVQQGLGADRLASLGWQFNTTIRTTGGHLRSFSTFVQPFPFAYFLMLVVLVGLASALADTARLRNRLFLASTPLLLIAMLFTFVRGAWLGLAAGWLYLGLRQHRSLLVVIPFALLAVAYLPGTITQSAFQSTSLAERGSGWRANLDQVIAHPLGVGIGASGAAAAVVAGNAQTDASTTPAALSNAISTYQPDNYFYKTAYELGVVGLWLLVLLLIGAFAEANRAARRWRRKDAAFARGSAAFVVAAIGASLVSTFFEIFPMDVFFWMLLGIVAAREPTREPVTECEPA